MSHSWSALHARLLRSVNRNPAAFHDLRERHAVLARFGDASELLAFLHARGGDPEAKNAVLRVLVADAAELPTELVILALWPGLDAVRGRLRRHMRSDIAQLDAELVGRLSLAIRNRRLGRVNRVAATLLRNLERDLRREMAAAAAIEKERDPFEEATVRDDRDAPVAEAARDLCGHLGADGPLIVCVVVLGMSQKEAGACLGLGHDQARKRYQRAIDRLKRDLSHSGSEDGFSPVRAPQRRAARSTK